MVLWVVQIAAVDDVDGYNGFDALRMLTEECTLQFYRDEKTPKCFFACACGARDPLFFCGIVRKSRRS